MAATIHDVAKLAGVNPSTVSRALSGKAVITEETREKIYAAMRELDYHPNSVARSLASGLSGAIGVVVDAQDADAFSNVFFSRSLFAIEKVAQSRGYHVIIANGAKRAGGASSIEGLMLERKVDGLILPPSTLKSALLEKIEGFPYVVLGQPDTARRGLSWVDVNNEQGGAMAVEHLRQMGYARIAYLGGGGRTGFVKRRVNTKIYDEVIGVTNEDAFETGRQIGRLEGVLVGISSGAAAWVAIEMARRPENRGKTIVTLLPDTGDRYLSTPLFAD